MGYLGIETVSNPKLALREREHYDGILLLTTN